MKANVLTMNESPSPAEQLRLSCVVIGFHQSKLSVLLQRKADKTSWGLPTASIEQGKDIDQGAAELIRQLSKGDEDFVRQLRLYNQNSQPGLTLAYYAIVDHYDSRLPQSIKWLPVQECNMLTLQENCMLHKAIESLRFNLLTEPIAVHLLPGKFTLLEIQSLFEEILGKKLDRRNFLRKLSSQKMLIKLKEKKSGVAYKPPTLYKLSKDKYATALNEVLNRIW